MILKAIFPARRAREVNGIPREEFMQHLSKAQRVRWFNGREIQSELSVREVSRRVNAMPEGSTVVVMAKNSRSKRAFPVDTSYVQEQAELLVIYTCFSA